MTQPQVTYRVLVRTDSYEPEREMGVYATRELAAAVVTFLHDNWDPEDEYKPELSAYRIEETAVFALMPEFHMWSANIDIATGEEMGVHRLGCPYRTPMEPMWETLAEPAKCVRHPMRFVAGSGRTAEEALANAWRHYEKAVALGAKDILAKCEELAEASHAEAERIEAEGQLDEEGNPPRPAWQTQSDILQDMAEAFWGVPTSSLP